MAGVVVALAAAVVLAPGTASATCALQPFDKAVRSSDAVLVATIAEARPAGPRQTGFTVRLDIEQVLKGSESDGERVRITGCGPPSPAATESQANHLVGERTLFLLSGSGGTLWEYPEVTTPQGMTLDQRIARAREVLDVPGIPPVGDTSARADDGSAALSPWPWVVGALLGVLAAIGLAVFVRRARRA